VLRVQELATLHILLLYNVPFKYSYGRLLLAFYPAFGGEAGRLLVVVVVVARAGSHTCISASPSATPALC
jgi:hypothetical protein